MDLELIPSARISSSGLDVQRKRMEAIASNLANVSSTADGNGNLYKKKVPLFECAMSDAMGGDSVNDYEGVKMVGMGRELRKPIEIYAPYHPKADESGMVQMPNISPIEEMIDMISATRAYEANLAAMKQANDMAEKTINVAKS